MNNKDESFWEGFDACVEMIKNYFENCEIVSVDQWALIMDEIDEEVDLYKKDG